MQVVEVVCCKPSALQVGLYNHFLASNAAQRVLSNSNTKGKASALTAINALRKLCAHPKLIYDLIHTPGKAATEADGFKVCLPPDDDVIQPDFTLLKAAMLNPLNGLSYCIV